MVLKCHISTECRKSTHTNEQTPPPSPCIHTTKLIIPSNHYPHHLDFHFTQNATNITDPQKNKKKNRTYNPDLILAFQCYIPGILSNSRTYDSIVPHPSPLSPHPPLSPSTQEGSHIWGKRGGRVFENIAGVGEVMKIEIDVKPWNWRLA